MSDEGPGDADDGEQAAGPPDGREREDGPGNLPRDAPAGSPADEDDSGVHDDAAGPRPPTEPATESTDDGSDNTDNTDNTDDSSEYAVGGSAADRYNPTDERRADAAPGPDERDGPDADPYADEQPDWTDPGSDEDIDVDAPATKTEGAAPDGGTDATEFGGDINPHANNTPGPAEGAAPESIGGASAPDDQEMPLARHIEEMVRRLGVVVVVMALVSGVTFPFGDRLISFLWYSFLPGSPAVCPTTDPTAEAACPYLFQPLALMFARLKVASLVGFIIAMPVIVYESYLFMRPGLYPRERRYYLASVPTSLVLAGVGVLFAYLLVLPTLFAYFTGYTNQAAEVTFSLTETFNLIVMMLGFFALVFQIPLLIMLAVMMGVTSRRWLAGRRIYFWGGFATVAFFFSPDPTGMAPILVAATMILLFEGTLALLYWTGEASSVQAEDIAARRPFAWLGAGLVGYVISTAPLPGSYYEQLPVAVTDALAGLGVSRLTPLLIGLGLVGVYEGGLYAYRQVGTNPRVYGTVARARVAVWPVSLFVGYLGSPDPALLSRVDAIELAAVEAGGVAVVLALTFEASVAVLEWYQRRE